MPASLLPGVPVGAPDVLHGPAAERAPLSGCPSVHPPQWHGVGVQKCRARVGRRLSSHLQGETRSGPARGHSGEHLGGGARPRARGGASGASPQDSRASDAGARAGGPRRAFPGPRPGSHRGVAMGGGGEKNPARLRAQPRRRGRAASPSGKPRGARARARAVLARGGGWGGEGARASRPAGTRARRPRPPARLCASSRGRAGGRASEHPGTRPRAGLSELASGALSGREGKEGKGREKRERRRPEPASRAPSARSPPRLARRGMHLHQVLTGAVNPGDNCYSVGSVGDAPFTVSGPGPGRAGLGRREAGRDGRTDRPTDRPTALRIPPRIPPGPPEPGRPSPEPPGCRRGLRDPTRLQGSLEGRAGFQTRASTPAISLTGDNAHFVSVAASLQSGWVEDRLCKRRDRADWPYMCLSVCLDICFI